MKRVKMKKTIKFVLMIFLVQMLLSYIPVNNVVYAYSNIEGQAYETYENKIHYASEGIFYNSVINESNVFCSSIDEAADYMRSEMVKRRSPIVFTINKTYYKGLAEEIFEKAVSYDDKLSSDEGDYLYEQFKSFNCAIKYTSKETTFEYNMVYYTTEKQEEEVNKEVKNVLEQLDVADKSEYTKIKKVHDYIVKNIKYDDKYENYSAYNAIIDKNVVCQGFASLTYKMLKELGIGVRVITGESSSGQPHAWNIVSLNGSWYDIDNTWDENLSVSGTLSYSYFLKNEGDFKGHNREKKYTTNDFNNQYPIAASSFMRQAEDFDGDEKIDISDLAQLAARYNLNINDKKWDNIYDVNEDGIVDIYDIVRVSSKL